MSPWLRQKNNHKTTNSRYRWRPTDLSAIASGANHVLLLKKKNTTKLCRLWDSSQPSQPQPKEGLPFTCPSTRFPFYTHRAAWGSLLRECCTSSQILSNLHNQPQLYLFFLPMGKRRTEIGENNLQKIRLTSQELEILTQQFLCLPKWPHDAWRFYKNYYKGQLIKQSHQENTTELTASGHTSIPTCP